MTEAIEGRGFDSAKPTVVVDEIIVMEPRCKDSHLISSGPTSM